MDISDLPLLALHIKALYDLYFPVLQIIKHSTTLFLTLNNHCNTFMNVRWCKWSLPSRLYLSVFTQGSDKTYKCGESLKFCASCSSWRWRGAPKRSVHSNISVMYSDPYLSVRPPPYDLFCLFTHNGVSLFISPRCLLLGCLGELVSPLLYTRSFKYSGHSTFRILFFFTCMALYCFVWPPPLCLIFSLFTHNGVSLFILPHYLLPGCFRDWFPRYCRCSRVSAISWFVYLISCGALESARIIITDPKQQHHRPQRR